MHFRTQTYDNKREMTVLSHPLAISSPSPCTLLERLMQQGIAAILTLDSLFNSRQRHHARWYVS